MKVTTVNRPVVASLYSHSSAAPKQSPSSRSGTTAGSNSQPHRSHPFSSISVSSDRTYAVASAKDLLHVLRLTVGSHSCGRGGSKVDSASWLEEIRSVRISQHFQSPLQSTATAAPQYPHLRDAMRLPGATAPSVGGGGGINISVTDVAWSLPQPYGTDDGVGCSEKEDGNAASVRVAHNRSDNFGHSHDESFTPSDIHDAEQHTSHHDQHYPTFIKRFYMGDGEHGQSFSAIPSVLDDTTVVAAAGSNGVVVAWNAHALIRDCSACTPLSSDSSGARGPSGRLFHARKSNYDRNPLTDNISSNVSSASAASVGQPEASFQAHSPRATNRLAWHPTGRRPYLLLSGGQDGTVKLWDRRATSPNLSVSSAPRTPAVKSTFNLSARKSWFGFSNSASVQNAQLPPTNAAARTASWHCVSTYQPKCEAVRDIRWNPLIDDIFAMVAGEWLCLYDIRFNRPMMKECTHAGDATSIDWHPNRRYIIATGGGRDRTVKVWDLESDWGGGTKHEDDASVNLKENSLTSRSEEDNSLSGASPTSSEGPFNSLNHPSANQTTPLGLQANSSAGSLSPMKRISSGIGLSRHNKKKLPLHVLNIAAPVTRIKWLPQEDSHDSQSNLQDSLLAVATSSIYGANAGGFGVVGLWNLNRPFMPISVCEGHKDGAVTDFAWASRSIKESLYQGSIGPTPSSESSVGLSRKWKYSRQAIVDGNTNLPRGFDNREKTSYDNNVPLLLREWPTIVTVGRDGQCLLQCLNFGQRPILEVPPATFSLANLSPFQPNFGSLQVVAVHQQVAEFSNILMSELVFSIIDRGTAEDISATPVSSMVDVAPELTHLSRFSELYVLSGSSTADVCRKNAAVAESLNQQAASDSLQAIIKMWKTLAIILDGSGLDGLPTKPSDSYSNPMAFMLIPFLRNLLFQRAERGDVQSCVVLCEVMDIIIPPVNAGGSPKSRIPTINISLIREWYFSYLDILQQMCLFTQAASLIKYCRDPVIGALNQQSTTIHESCPQCGKPIQGGTTVKDIVGSSRLSAQRVCRNCRSRIGLCFVCHEPVKGVFVWCPGCGHGGCLDHALEWFAMNEVCPTGCGHKCNLFPVLLNSTSHECSRKKPTFSHIRRLESG